MCRQQPLKTQSRVLAEHVISFSSVPIRSPPAADTESAETAMNPNWALASAQRHNWLTCFLVRLWHSSRVAFRDISNPTTLSDAKDTFLFKMLYVACLLFYNVSCVPHLSGKAGKCIHSACCVFQWYAASGSKHSHSLDFKTLGEAIPVMKTSGLQWSCTLHYWKW